MNDGMLLSLQLSAKQRHKKGKMVVKKPTKVIKAKVGKVVKVKIEKYIPEPIANHKDFHRLRIEVMRNFNFYEYKKN